MVTQEDIYYLVFSKFFYIESSFLLNQAFYGVKLLLNHLPCRWCNLPLLVLAPLHLPAWLDKLWNLLVVFAWRSLRSSALPPDHCPYGLLRWAKGCDLIVFLLGKNLHNIPICYVHIAFGHEFLFWVYLGNLSPYFPVTSLPVPLLFNTIFLGW